MVEIVRIVRRKKVFSKHSRLKKGRASALPPITLIPTKFANVSSFGVAIAHNVLSIYPLVYPNANTFGVDKETLFLATARFINANAYGVAKIKLTIAATKYTDADSFGTHKETLILAPLKYVNPNSFGVDKQTDILFPSRVVGVNTFGTQREAYIVHPVLYAEVNTFGHATVSTVFAACFVNQNRFGTHNISAAGGSSKLKPKKMGLEPVKKRKQAPPPAPLPPPPIPLPPADIIRPIEPTAPMPEPVMVGDFDPAHAAIIQHEVLSAQDEADAAAVIRSILAKRDHAHMQMLLSLI